MFNAMDVVFDVLELVFEAVLLSKEFLLLFFDTALQHSFLALEGRHF